MTNQIALALGLTLAALVALDAVVFDWSNCLFLAKKLADLIEWIAFWR
ncbi:MAG: hypothetical protein ACU0DK_06685 [Pseudooceanicola sp.]